jgi:hypothetical protein
MPQTALASGGRFFGRAKEFGVAAARRRSISFDCFSNGRFCVPWGQGYRASHIRPCGPNQ